jgi:hypothetical protein
VARIVCQIAGPVERLQLRHVPSDWVIVNVGRGPDLIASVERLRQVAILRGFVAEDGVTVEDWNSRIEGMLIDHLAWAK